MSAWTSISYSSSWNPRRLSLFLMALPQILRKKHIIWSNNFILGFRQAWDMRSQILCGLCFPVFQNNGEMRSILNETFQFTNKNRLLMKKQNPWPLQCPNSTNGRHVSEWPLWNSKCNWYVEFTWSSYVKSCSSFLDAIIFPLCNLFTKILMVCWLTLYVSI